MTLAVNIAVGLGAGLIMRSLSNAAFAATMPEVDPKLPYAGPVLTAAAVPCIPAALLWKKHRTIASALVGVGVGAAVSTAEYMSFARDAQGKPQLPPAKSYKWLAVKKDAQFVEVASGTYDLAGVAAKDAEIVSKYDKDDSVVMIVRKNDKGESTVLVNRVLQSGAAARILRR